MCFGSSSSKNGPSSPTLPPKPVPTSKLNGPSADMFRTPTFAQNAANGRPESAASGHSPSQSIRRSRGGGEDVGNGDGNGNGNGNGTVGGEGGIGVLDLGVGVTGQEGKEKQRTETAPEIQGLVDRREAGVVR